MLIIAAYDSVQPSIGLRGGSRNDVPSSSSSIKIEPVLPKLIIPDEPKPQTNEKQDCGNYNEDSCNSKQDALGNVCHWCTKANDRVCVSAKSTNYMFAPCNSWICHDERDRSKSDITTCERVWRKWTHKTTHIVPRRWMVGRVMGVKVQENYQGMKWSSNILQREVRFAKQIRKGATNSSSTQVKIR